MIHGTFSSTGIGRRSSSVLVVSERFHPENFLINDLVRRWTSGKRAVRVLTQVPSYPRDRLVDGYRNRFSIESELGAIVYRVRTVLGYSRSVVRKISGYVQFAVRASWVALFHLRTCERAFVYHTGPLTQAIPVVILKILGRCSHAVIWSQDIWPDTVFAYGFSEKGMAANLLKRFVRFIYRYFDVVLVSSPGFVGRLAQYVDARKGPWFVPQWVPSEFSHDGDTDFVRPRPLTTFVYTGNLGTMQNLEKVVLAFKEVQEHCCLCLVGDGSMKTSLQSLVRTNGISNVYFYGVVPVSHVKSVIQACDFAVLSLIDDPLVSLTIPAKFQAYLAAGRPIVCVSRGEVAEIVKSEGIGITADPNDVNAISDAFRAATKSDEAQRSAWSRRMIELLESRFDAETITDSISRAVFKNRVRGESAAS